jgi:hypothetical protein
MAFTEDFADFLDTTHGFAVNATIGAATVPVIFDAAYAEPLGMSGSTPVALGVSADLAAATPGAAISIDGSYYRVTAVEPDGTGMTQLRLSAGLGSGFDLAFSSGFGA